VHADMSIFLDAMELNSSPVQLDHESNKVREDNINSLCRPLLKLQQTKMSNKTIS